MPKTKLLGLASLLALAGCMNGARGLGPLVTPAVKQLTMGFATPPPEARPRT